jgi:hypothetical protein
MSMPGCVKIAAVIFIGHFSQVFLDVYDIFGRNFHDIFRRNVSLVTEPANPNILCPGRAQVLHSLPTTLRTLSAALTAARGTATSPLAVFRPAAQHPRACAQAARGDATPLVGFLLKAPRPTAHRWHKRFVRPSF